MDLSSSFESLPALGRLRSMMNFGTDTVSLIVALLRLPRPTSYSRAIFTKRRRSRRGSEFG